MAKPVLPSTTLLEITLIEDIFNGDQIITFMRKDRTNDGPAQIRWALYNYAKAAGSSVVESTVTDVDGQVYTLTTGEQTTLEGAVPPPDTSLEIPEWTADE